MSERDQLVQSIITAAIASAGPRGNNDGAWLGKINASIPSIAAMMNEGTRQWKTAVEVLDADVFTAVYRGHTLEESSKRMIVTLETKPSKKYPDGLEPIRTHRTDNAAGKQMAARLDQLADGDELVIWKSMETSAHDADVKVRVLVHFQTRPKFSSTAATRSEEPAQRASSNPPAASAEPRQDAPTPAGAQADSIVTERFDNLSGKVKAAVVRRARAEGITIPVPQEDRLDDFIQIMIEEEAPQ